MSDRDYLAALRTWAMINEIDEPPLDWAMLGDIIRGLAGWRRATVTPEQVEAAAKLIARGSTNIAYWDKFEVADREHWLAKARAVFELIGLSVAEGETT